MKWFKHDSDAYQNPKLLKLRVKYGMEGYGLYWFCLELIANEVSGDKYTFELEHDSELISHLTGIHIERVQEMMTYMVNLNLFEIDQGVITCLRLAKRLDERYTRSDDLKKVIRLSSDKLATVGARREEKRREENNRGFHPPSPREVQEYLDQQGITAFTGEDFVNHYASVDWMRGKNKIKSWKHCVGTWRKNNPEPDKYGEGAI